MSTSNFHSVNASKIFMIEIETDFDYEDATDNLECVLEEEFKNSYTENRCNDMKDENELRSYPSRVLGQVYGDSRTYKKLEIDVFVVVDIVIRTGYYENANFDYNIKFDIGDEKNVSEDELFDTLVDNAMYYNDMSKEEAVRNAKFAEKFLEKAMADLRNEVEKIFEQYSTPLNCIGVASNGEALYEVA